MSRIDSIEMWEIPRSYENSSSRVVVLLITAESRFRANLLLKSVISVLIFLISFLVYSIFDIVLLTPLFSFFEPLWYMLPPLSVFLTDF